MKSILFILIVSSVLFTSCKNEAKTTNNVETVQKISSADTLQLTFNKGDKWLVNAETHEGVKNMEAIINQFNSENSENYKELGDKLSKQTSYVIKNCTMTGEPHDQLHVVLVPMLDEISALRESNNLIMAKASLSNLEELIQAYFKHFNL
ncbi:MULTISPECIES: hypothetical protein [Bizionia]|uniref:Uncharacterized protein n=1 Tax=Bizionia algoritergicola TaxID=291187 RepID=A0A5D0QPG4_9FLAO|nr:MULTISPECIES: hypothetical protein [Bizionia]OBX22574.1 hypothetical protein BAA08_08120 [Bizionia sp. APA-3]TYB70765.1 hypothetical protein ES675_14740 [Bizionia algoritergicola]